MTSSAHTKMEVGILRPINLADSMLSNNLYFVGASIRVAIRHLVGDDQYHGDLDVVTNNARAAPDQPKGE
jgi:hypothetical protein